MKTMTRPNIYLPLALVLTAALSLPVAAQKLVPFKGTMQGHDTDIGGPMNAFVVDTNGTGIATHLGQFSFSQENTVNLDTGTETGSGHWIAANGDSIYTTIVGSGEPTDTPNVISITEINTIIGGTGRFAGAQGSFTVERLANAATFVTSGSLHGAITSPGAAN